MSEGLSAEDVTLYHQIERAVGGGHNRILIVGGRDSNWPQDLRGHPLLTFWDTTDPAAQRKQWIPQGVGCVIFTRFVGHGRNLDHIRKIASPDVTLLPGAFPPGKIKRILRPLLRALDANVAPAEREVPEPLASFKGTAVSPPAPPSVLQPPKRLRPKEFLKDKALLGAVLAEIATRMNPDRTLSGKACGIAIKRYLGPKLPDQYIKSIIRALIRAGLLEEAKLPGKTYPWRRITEKGLLAAKAAQVPPPPPASAESLGREIAERAGELARREQRLTEFARRAGALLDELTKLCGEFLERRSM